MSVYRFLRTPVVYRAGRIESAGYEQAIHDLAAEGWELVLSLIHI